MIRKGARVYDEGGGRGRVCDKRVEWVFYMVWIDGGGKVDNGFCIDGFGVLGGKRGYWELEW